MPLKSPNLVLVVLLSTLALARAAGATDGILEINQTCAVQTGCFPGDDPDFPVSIQTAPVGPGKGSYRLTSNLEVATADTTAIFIRTNGVSLDLAGFSISGPVTCVGVPVTGCTPVGVGIGVLGTSDVVLKNGVITGVGGDAVQLDFSARAEGLNVFQNGGSGIVLGNESLSIGNVVTSNGGDGIRCLEDCAVSENSSTGNRGQGINVRSGTVTGNTASRNAESGGFFGSNTTFAGNAFRANAGRAVIGGHAGSGNSCSDASCSGQGQRRYYLTAGTHTGGQVLTACDPGFHTAQMAEISDVSALMYDHSLSSSVSSGDVGSGPPSRFGWVRTGVLISSSGAGSANCDDWTNSVSGTGSTAHPGYNDAGGWQMGVGDTSCALDIGVWCVED